MGVSSPLGYRVAFVDTEPLPSGRHQKYPRSQLEMDSLVPIDTQRSTPARESALLTHDMRHRLFQALM